MWLLAAARREPASADGAFEVFKDLHDRVRLLPADADELRDRVKSVARVLEAAHNNVPDWIATLPAGTDANLDLGEGVTARANCSATDEIWVAIPTRTATAAELKRALARAAVCDLRAGDRARRLRATPGLAVRSPGLARSRALYLR